MGDKIDFLDGEGNEAGGIDADGNVTVKVMDENGKIRIISLEEAEKIMDRKKEKSEEERQEKPV